MRPAPGSGTAPAEPESAPPAVAQTTPTGLAAAACGTAGHATARIVSLIDAQITGETPARSACGIAGGTQEGEMSLIR